MEPRDFDTRCEYRNYLRATLAAEREAYDYAIARYDYAAMDRAVYNISAIVRSLATLE